MNNFSLTRLFSFVAVIIVLAALVYFVKIGGAGVSSIQPKKDTYQAVFLPNNQLYFGKLEIAPDMYILHDIYYLQSNRNPSAGKDESEKNNIQLIKFGEELHGPEDALYMERTQVLFWENLKPDSKIIQAVKQHKEKAASAAASAQ